MASSSIMRKLKMAASVAGEAAAKKVSVEQVIEQRFQQKVSRREFLQNALMATAVMAVPPAVWNLGTRIAHAKTSPRVAVVGAGLAGLTCAYRLKQAGILADVYEASTRVGGRCFSKTDGFANGQIIERGGELINSDHQALLRIISELNLRVDDLWEAEKPGTEFKLYMNGDFYSLEEIGNAFTEIWDKLQKDVRKAGYPTLYNNYTRGGWELDHMSVIDWIEETIPNGVNSKFGHLIDVAYMSSVGLESKNVSAITLINGMGQSSRNEFEPFGPSDERYHVRGGNGQVPEGLARMLKDQIYTSAPLNAVSQNSDGSYTLGFSGSTQNVKADLVVLALPVATLRDVDLSRAGFRRLKLTAIEEMGVATNSKLAVQFTDRHWEDLGSSGAIVSDVFQNSWDATRGQSGTSGILINFTGGPAGLSFKTGSPKSHATEFLQQIEPMLPGLTDKWNGKATVDCWPAYKWTKGSYSCYKVGQYTKFGGIMGEPEGNCFFAGEHTSLQYQQFMNGAVETGERAAQEVLSRLQETASISTEQRV
ncbi:monoamine oxidase [Brevibacillus choshinensis]|uniref:Monoamine oxidase n=1 Tax=Brevibacillus choshinensis TaxID=54911 RepID=A0ABR5NE63_BRECH|nr:NAD(P)/FAD-dependent oxidoreductase [Brevibacillus choshinensis]KQL49694.1 monoamine oxidase [Brevibacillus choshinensis]